MAVFVLRFCALTVAVAYAAVVRKAVRYQFLWLSLD